MRADLFIEAKAIGKGRPRFYGGHAVTPQATRDYERMIGREYARQCGQDFGAAPLDVAIMVTYTMPKSWTKSKRAEKMKQPHTQKPDADNIAKAILDGLQQGGAYEDDCQIASLRVYKKWSDRDTIRVSMREHLEER